MIGNQRRGFVGLMVTLALGAAVGAAVLVVGREMARSGSAKGPDQIARLARSRQGQLAVAAKAYVHAKERYDEAVLRNGPEVLVRREALLRARTRYEKLILATTPGMVSLSAVPLPMNPVPMPIASEADPASGITGSMTPETGLEIDPDGVSPSLASPSTSVPPLASGTVASPANPAPAIASVPVEPALASATAPLPNPPMPPAAASGASALRD